MGELKSAYEIAMENANQIAEDNPEKTRELELRDKLKPILSRFYRDKIDAEELWQELKNEEDQELYREAQKLMAESIGLRNTDMQLKKRKQGILAIENLKQQQNSSRLEQILKQVSRVKEQYKQQQEQLEERIRQETEQNSQVQMKPVQTEDGRTVMKMEPSVDKETQERFKKLTNDLEEQANQQLSQLLEQLKQSL